MHQTTHQPPRRAHLQTLLRDHTPVDDIEREHHRRCLALLAAEGDPFFRRHFKPGHFTASAFILSPDATALLLIEHSKLHRWLQPGGHVDAGDVDVVAAARREAAEEAGVTDLAWQAGLFDVDVHPMPARGDEPGHEHFDLRFLFRAASWEIRAGSDAKAARWVPLRDVTPRESGFAILRGVGKLIARAVEGGAEG